MTDRELILQLCAHGTKADLEALIEVAEGLVPASRVKRLQLTQDLVIRELAGLAQELES